MTDFPLPDPPRRFPLDWLLPALLFPRRAFARIAAQSGGVWLLPILLITLSALTLVFVTAPLRQEAAQSGQALPPEYYSPEQQAQLEQALAITSGPVFIYLFPALSAVLGAVAGWLVVAGIMHFVLTLLGGRSTGQAAMNLVAWAGLPFAVRDLLRMGYTLSTHQLIQQTGLGGFAPSGEGGFALYVAALLALIDLFLIWHAGLLMIGMGAATGLSRGKTALGVLGTLLLVLLAQALFAFLVARFAGLDIIRPFFF